MPTRIRQIFEQGTGKLLSLEPYEVSDEQIQNEQEEAEIEKIKSVLAADWDTTQMQKVLKLLIRRLVSKGILP